MPIQSNEFDRFTDTAAADEACLTAMGVACQQLAQTTGYDEAGIGVVTGNLRRSHTFNVSGDHVDVGVTADYGGHVHFGTAKHPTARPWLRKTMQKHRDSIIEAGKRAWGQVMGE
jgi:hypothetical protein